MSMPEASDPIRGDVLVVDDTPANLGFLATILAGGGYNVRQATNGKLALRSALAKPPGLILLDIKMPDIDGYEVCRRLKADESTRDVPVIFVTVLSEVEERVRGFEAGGVDFVCKPFQEAEVLARVKTHLTLSNLRRDVEARNADLRAANLQLAGEVQDRKRAEEALQRAHDELEMRVRERTGELAKANEELRAETADRRRAQEELARHRDHLEELVKERTRELDKSREQLQRAERLASLGTLAAGIAHEINNPLGMMLLSTDMALRSLDRPETLAELLEQQKRHMKRCAHIIKSVLNFARPRSAEKSLLDLNEVVRHGMDFTQESARLRDVHVETALVDPTCPLMGNLTELEQVVVNLVENAVQACGKGGHVTVETRAEDGMVRLTVRDDGCGMTREQIEHAFDPFYSTRHTKGGTGLGLSTVHSIVAGHEGTIEIVSETGRGAVFTLAFPRLADVESGPGR